VLVHGDYRLDNMIFHANEPRVLGIIDWEISTLGDPLAELSYLCMLWRTPKDWGGLGSRDLGALGLPTEHEMVSYYCGLSKRPMPDPALWDFYMAYNLFRVSCIRQGVYARALDGTASNVRAADSGKLVRPAAELGWKIVESIGGGAR
jgi:acyl-CoA dehydrogenase